jgi:putative cofactor-binding repeat protein
MEWRQTSCGNVAGFARYRYDRATVIQGLFRRALPLFATSERSDSTFNKCRRLRRSRALDKEQKGPWSLLGRVMLGQLSAKCHRSARLTDYQLVIAFTH